MAAGNGLKLNLPPPTPLSRPTSSYSAFNLPSSSSSDTDPDAPLPFPTALARRDFLAPDFHAPTYLSGLFPSDDASTLAHRHQTLEDLRSELRERSTAISAELLELVNANYTSFLGLGDELKGGEDRVEDVRVALLGFRRQVDEIKCRVRGRRNDAARVSGVLGGVRGDIELGRRMLELDDRLALLEGRLSIGSLPNGAQEDEWGAEDSDEEEDAGETGDSFVGSSPAKLNGLAREYGAIEKLVDSLGRELPYVKKMEERMIRCRNTMLLDLGTAMKEARKAGDAGHDRVLNFMATYRQLGAHAEGVRILKER